MSLPNIVLVVLDTARRDRFGCYGYPRPTTPTVDALAAEGLVVETMISNAPWTLPAHASLFTGLYPSEHGTQWQTGKILREGVAPTMAEWLTAEGYDTWCATNNGLISSRSGLSRGFAHYAFRLDVERGVRRLRRRVGKALFGGDSGGRVMNDWLRDHLPAARAPFFLFVNYLECHWSYAPPARFLRRVGGERLAPLEGLRYRIGTAARVGPWEAIARADERELRFLSTLYDGELASADDHLRDLLGMLKAQGHLKRPTLIIVTSDHGEHIGERGLADHHAALDDLLIRVPFIAWGPGVVPRGQAEDLFEFVDVLPSLAALLGRPSPAPYLSSRRRHLFSGVNGGGTGVAFSEWRAWTDKERTRLEKRNPSYDFAGLARDLVCARDLRFKLVAGSDGSRVLYDVHRDPEESTDISAAYPVEVDRLTGALDDARRRWASWEQPGASPDLSPEDEREIDRRLAELGYI